MNCLAGPLARPFNEPLNALADICQPGCREGTAPKLTPAQGPLRRAGGQQAGWRIDGGEGNLRTDWPISVTWNPPVVLDFDRHSIDC